MKKDRGLKEENGMEDIKGKRKLLSMILHKTILSVLVIAFCMTIF